MASAADESVVSSIDKTLASLDISDLNDTQDVDESDPHVSQWMLPLEPLFKLCLKFYKDNNGKALQLKYEDKMKLVALHKQVTCGKYKVEGEAPGFLDVVGNDRRIAWQSLGDMNKETAMIEFVKLLHSVSPTLKPYIQAFRMQLDEHKKKKREAEAKAKAEAEALAQLNMENQQKMQEQQQQNLQEQQVRQALNQQTQAQFTQYAQSQFPNSPDQQEALVKQLQEQHFQQYVKQVYEQQLQQQPQELQSQVGVQGGGDVQAKGGESGGAIAQVSTPPTGTQRINGHPGRTTDSPGDVVLAEASMWTQKDTLAFKNAIRKESKMANNADSIIKVGSGETVTIRVPTHESGNCLFWEFATDHYDVAFGVYFEWSSPTDDNVQVHVSDSSDDEDELNNEDGNDPEKGGDDVKKPRGPPVDEIIPIYRRDSHEEVYCGSHVYPGRGVYLLKFDNSFSLWRSKTLYYRVYYSR